MCQIAGSKADHASKSVTSLAIDSAAAQHDEVERSEPVYEELVRRLKMTNGSRVQVIL